MTSRNRIATMRLSNPVVHCITNIVVANFQANGLLAIGASPIMADAIEEAAEIAEASSCTLLNIGTLNAEKVEAMMAAGKSARRVGNPLIVDPVGAGATHYRRETVKQLLNELDVTLIRGNAGEIAAIAGVSWTAKGVDAGSGTADIHDAARYVATQNNCLVAVTGQQDIVTDGKSSIRVSGGSERLTQITGSGCLLSAIIGAFLAVEKNNSLQAIADSLALYKKAGERAASASEGPGDFAVHFINALQAANDSWITDEQFTYEQEVS